LARSLAYRQNVTPIAVAPPATAIHKTTIIMRSSNPSSFHRNVRTSVMAAIATTIMAIEPIPRFLSICRVSQLLIPVGVRPGERSPSRNAG
jgi:hypothetical protein